MDHRDPIASLDRSAAFLGRLVEAWARAAEGRLLEQSISYPGRSESPINPDYLRQVDLASQILWRLAAVRKTLVLIEQHLNTPPPEPSPSNPAQSDDEPAEPAPPAAAAAPDARDPAASADAPDAPDSKINPLSANSAALVGRSGLRPDMGLPGRTPARTDSPDLHDAPDAVGLPNRIPTCPTIPNVPTLLIDLDDTESLIRNARWAHHRLTRMGELPPLPPGSLGPSAPALPPRADDDFRFDCERQFPDLYPAPYPPAPHPDP